MRRFTVRRMAAGLLLATLLTAPAIPGSAQQSQPPHAWLFGSWTGGLFPVPGNLTAQACLAAPVVIFTRDIVLRATLTDVTFTQRVIETARTNPNETEFRFSPANSGQAGNALLGVTAGPTAAGFGCESPDVLHVQRRSDNEITFPGCAEFPNPLVRCPAR